MTPPAALVPAVLDWYDRHARDLPWRRPGTSPWAVLVSEVMLQQTPVARVAPAWHGVAGQAGRTRRPWPRRRGRTCCGSGAGSATRAGRCGCTRRLAWSSPSTVASCPTTSTALEALPGVGPYTARAVAAFAFGQRLPVVDTNVRRVVARVVSGVGDGGTAVDPARPRRCRGAAARGRRRAPPGSASR